MPQDKRMEAQSVQDRSQDKRAEAPRHKTDPKNNRVNGELRMEGVPKFSAGTANAVCSRLAPKDLPFSYYLVVYQLMGGNPLKLT